MRGHYGRSIVGDAPEPRYAARRRAVKSIFYLHDRTPAPFYVYAEVEGSADAQPASSESEALGRFTGLSHLPGAGYVAVFDASGDAWPNPARESMGGTRVGAAAIEYGVIAPPPPPIGFGLDDLRDLALGPLGATAVKTVTTKTEIPQADLNAALAAGNAAAAPLAEQHAQLMLSWPASKTLTRDQMTKILREALTLGHGCEAQLADLITKVPAHQVGDFQLQGTLTAIRQLLAQAPNFERLIATVADVHPAPTAPWGAKVSLQHDFRAWIDHLFNKSEDCVIAIAYVAHLIPDWLRAVDLMSALYHAASAAIRAIIALAEGAGQVLDHLGDVGKYLLIGGGVLGGILVLSYAFGRK